MIWLTQSFTVMSIFEKDHQNKTMMDTSQQSSIFEVCCEGFFYYDPNNHLREAKREYQLDCNEKRGRVRVIDWGNTFGHEADSREWHPEGAPTTD
jgi:hypothetical protein